MSPVPRWRTVRKHGQSFDVIDRYSCAERLHDVNNVDFWRVFESGWEDDTFNVMRRHLRRGVTFLDLGAWLGTMTIFAARLCDRVVAVEPDHVAAGDCRQHILENRIDNVDLHESAIAPTSGTIKLGRKTEGAWGDSMSSVYYSAETLPVRAVTLDEVKPAQCGLIKMDIEGYEAEILDGYVLDCPLWLSTHEHLVPDPSEYRRKLDAFLAAHRVAETSGDNLLVLPR